MKMNKKVLPLILFCVAAFAQEPLELQKEIKKVIKKAVPAFVFFGGGSGVLISEDGYILTNDHVRPRKRTGRQLIAEKEITITLTNGRKYLAKMVATDVAGDLCLFKIQPEEEEKFPYLKLGDSDKLEVGEYVIALGNPLLLAEKMEAGLSPTVTLGTISALHVNFGRFYNAIMTDAPINPGNSGGPLINLAGEIVGINSRIAARFAPRINSGVGYAVPSSQIKRFLKVMKTCGKREHVYHGQIVGLRVRDERNGMLKVSKVSVNSHAEEAGFKLGDYIIKIGEYEIKNRARFISALWSYPEGSKIKVVALRRGKKITLEVVLKAKAPRKIRPPANVYLGIEVERAPPTEELGVIITKIEDESPAQRAGLEVGDIIIGADGKCVLGVEDFYKILKAKSPGDMIKIKVVRKIEAKEVIKEFEIILAKPR
jgi:serine protease Do